MVVVAVVSAPMLAQQTETAKTIAELKQLDRELDRIFEQGDLAAAQRLLADEMINIAPEGTVSKKEEFIRNVKPLKAGTTLTIAERDVEVFLFGNTGVVTSNKTAKLQRRNGSSSDDYRETNTYAFKDGQWFLIASQTSHAPPPYTAKDLNVSLTVDEKQIGGNREASVVLIEFADYECPYCRDFASSTMKQIEHDYIDSRRIGFVFSDLPLESVHPHAFSAALAALCAGEQGQLWEMNHKLLAETTLTSENLLRHAETLKLDMAKFGQCFADEKTAKRLRQNIREAAELGIDGTPTFIVGIRKPGSNTIKGLRLIEGGLPYNVFKTTLDMLIATQN
jgi:protein-disulfide isomerase